MKLSADNEAWTVLNRLHAQVEHELAEAVQRGHGLGLSEHRALCHLAKAPEGELRMQELAEALGLNQSSVTRLVARLENAGLTRRDLCANDRRGVYSVITDAGRERWSRSVGTYEIALTGALDRAAEDPELARYVEAVRGVVGAGLA